jgi:hypothetical protein
MPSLIITYLKSPLNSIKSLYSNAQAGNKLYIFLRVRGAYRVILRRIYGIPLLYIASYYKK